MHPLNHIVANVHRVGVGREQFHLKRIAEPGGFKRLIPPGRAVHQGRTNGFGRAGVEVVHNRLDGVTDSCQRVALFQPVPRDVALRNGLANGRGVVEKLNAAVADARIEPAGFVGVGTVERRQLHERVVLVHGHGGRRWHHLAQVRTGSFARERNDCLELGILGKTFRAGQVHRAPHGVEFVGALLRLGDGLRGSHGVLHQKRRQVDQHPVLFFGGNLETGMNRLRKGFFHGPPFERVVCDSAVSVVWLNQQHFVTAALKLNHVLLPQPPPV